MKLILLIFVIIFEICVNLQESLSSREQILKSISVFDIIETNNDPKLPSQANQQRLNPIPQTNYQQRKPIPRNTQQNSPVRMNPPKIQTVNNKAPSLPIEQMLENLKSRVTNPFLKTNFTLPNIANFFASFVSGNEHLNQIQVNNLAQLKNVDISEILNVNQKANINNLELTNLVSPVLNITENGIEIDPESIIKMKDTKINFKAKDIFEVIAFMKYILKICGSRLEKCDFKNLLTLNKTEEVLNIMKFMTLQNINMKNTSTVEAKPIPTPSSNNNNITSNKVKKQKKKNLRKSEFKFKQINDFDFDKEINNAINHYNEPKATNAENDYNNLFDTPDIQKYMNDYYYSARIFK